jgi:hypothetical protein
MCDFWHSPVTALAEIVTIAALIGPCYSWLARRQVQINVNKALTFNLPQQRAPMNDRLTEEMTRPAVVELGLPPETSLYMLPPIALQLKTSNSTPITRVAVRSCM